MPGQAVATSTEVRDAAASHVQNLSVESRPKFARLSRDPQRAIKQMAARIKFLIQFCSDDGESLRVRQIKRALHADRYAEFDGALSLLEKRKQIIIRRVPSRSRPVFIVILKRSRRIRLPDPYTFHRRKKRKKRNKPTEWFLSRRQSMDRGFHGPFAQINPCQESAYWLEKEKALEEQVREDQVEVEPE